MRHPIRSTGTRARACSTCFSKTLPHPERGEWDERLRFEKRLTFLPEQALRALSAEARTTEKPLCVPQVFRFVEGWCVMASRHKRYFSEHDEAELLHRIGAWRRDCVAVSARAPINGPIYLAMDALRGAIDGVAEAVTGDP